MMMIRIYTVKEKIVQTNTHTHTHEHLNFKTTTKIENLILKILSTKKTKTNILYIFIEMIEMTQKKITLNLLNNNSFNSSIITNYVCL